MTTTDGLIQAILQAPDDDAPRLVYADALEEDGDLERAFFIRLQLRIAAIEAACLCGRCVKLRGGGQHTNGACAVDQERDELPDGRSKQAMLRRRERELLDAIGSNPFRFSDGINLIALPGQDTSTNGLPVGVLRRGFVDEVVASMGWFVGEPCQRCGGMSGMAYTAANPCPDCHGTTITAAHGPTLMRRAPVRLVRVSDREPYYSPSVLMEWCWFRDPNEAGTPSTEAASLPVFLFDLLAGGHLHAGQVRAYDSSADATSALSAALIRWAQAQAV